MKYILDSDHDVIQIDDVEIWGAWFESADRVVAVSYVGTVMVSTVFLGLDHSFGVGERPILFETIVFGGALDGAMNRYATWDEAAAGHEVMVSRVERAERDAPSVVETQPTVVVETQRVKRGISLTAVPLPNE